MLTCAQAHKEREQKVPLKKDCETAMESSVPQAIAHNVQGRKKSPVLPL